MCSGSGRIPKTVSPIVIVLCTPGLQSPSGFQSWEIKGCSLGGNLKHWGTRRVKAPLHEILAIWSMAERGGVVEGVQEKNTK